MKRGRHRSTNMTARGTAWTCIGCALLVAVVSCVRPPAGGPFHLTGEPFRVKGKTLAVVAGLNKESNIAVAECLNEALRRHSRFQVMPSRQVARSLASYPVSIEGPYVDSYFEIETDFSRTDVRKVRELQQAIGVDYLFIIWLPTEYRTGREGIVLKMVGQLFESPSGREVGNTVFVSSTEPPSGCLLPQPPRDINESLRKTCDAVAKSIAEKTAMSR